MKPALKRLLIEGIGQLVSQTTKKAFSSLKITVEETLLRNFEIYLQELSKWNKAYNITAIKKEEEIIQKHFLDSLLFLPFLNSPGMSVIDAGSGGGFPGLVIKIVRPDLILHLVEPSRKKSAFLRHMVFKLRLSGIEIHQKRVEELQGSLMVDAIVSRALFKLKDIIKLGSPLLKDKGIIVVSKGPEVYKELAELKSMNIQKNFSGESNSGVEVIEILLPTTDIKRYMIMVKL